MLATSLSIVQIKKSQHIHSVDHVVTHFFLLMDDCKAQGILKGTLIKAAKDSQPLILASKRIILYWSNFADFISDWRFDPGFGSSHPPWAVDWISGITTFILWQVPWTKDIYVCWGEKFQNFENPANWLQNFSFLRHYPFKCSHANRRRNFFPFH